VDSRPGVTRDVHVAEAEWAGRRFYVVDTGGIVEGGGDEMEEAIRRQAMGAIENADVIVLVVDGREGIHPLDEHIAQILREREARTVLVVNKLDRMPETSAQYEFYALGLGEPMPLAAISGKGSGDVLDRIVDVLPPEVEDATREGALRLAVVGRPNVGKSSFINRVLGVERLVVSREPGTTRDAVDTSWEYDGRPITFIDTAGLRKRSRVTEELEYYATVRTLRAIDRADVCLLLVDASEGVGNQDFRIARRVWDRGRGLVMAVNKWDLVEKDTHTAARVEKALRERVPFLEHVPIVFISALTGQRVHRAIDLAQAVGEGRSRRIETPEVNEVLRALTGRVHPPHYRGRPIKLYYATQARTGPPLFVVWCNFPREIPKHYVRYLVNGFREAWGFEGSPIRVRFRARSRRRHAG
jgi:GTP-binding protein